MAPSDDVDISALLQSISQESPIEASGREKILETARKIVSSLESPVQKTFDIIFSFGGLPCVRIASDLGLFTLLGTGPKSASDIATSTDAEQLLIIRIMRTLVNMGVFKLVGPEIYGPTAVSNFLCIPPINDGLKHCFDMGYQPCAKLPEYLRKTGFRNPQDHMDGPFQYAFGTKLDWFTWMKDHPREASQFNSFMTSYRDAKKPWVDIFPAEDIIYEGLGTEENIAVVDLGGGYGHDLRMIQSKFRRVPERLILQDQEEVVKAIPPGTISGIDVTAHDFFQDQPIKGARAYILKNVLHDWPKPKAVEILKRVAAAMKKGYSKIIIIENIIPEGQIPPAAAGLDIILMVAYAASMRTEEQWRELLDEAGLDVKQLWKQEDGDGMIETVLK